MSERIDTCWTGCPPWSHSHTTSYEPIGQELRALRESHAELLAAMREIGSVCNCGLYDTKANRTHMKWCAVVVAKAAIERAEAINAE